MAKFYFTYGSGGSSQAFTGGWTEVEAENIVTAQRAYAVFHKPVDGVLPYAFSYGEDEFRKTGMLARGNYGVKCHERITITREFNT